MIAASVARGRFITLEGGEGAGKSTQARLLATWLAGRGIAVELTREPGGAPGAEEIRTLLVTGETRRWDPLAETLLHFAARREHLVRRIAPALEAGRWVVCDRFADSTVAYQGYGQGVDGGAIGAIRHAAIGAVTPDLTLMLDVSPQTWRARTAGRPGAEDRYERMDDAFHDRVRAGFLAIAAQEPSRCAVIDANLPLDAVAGAIESEVASRLLV
jgi:dTMP kinase